jgi:hypothetical protein
MAIITCIRNVIGDPGHPDQFPYIHIWQTLTAHPPWLKKCFKDSYKIVLSRSTNTPTLKKKKGSSPSAPDAPQHGKMEKQCPSSPVLVWGSCPSPTTGRMMYGLCPDGFSRS